MLLEERGVSKTITAWISPTNRKFLVSLAPTNSTAGVSAVIWMGNGWGGKRYLAIISLKAVKSEEKSELICYVIEWPFYPALYGQPIVI